MNLLNSISSMAFITSFPLMVFLWPLIATLLAQEVAYKTNTDAAFATVRALRIKNHLAQFKTCTTYDHLTGSLGFLGNFYVWWKSLLDDSTHHGIRKVQILRSFGHYQMKNLKIFAQFSVFFLNRQL